MPCLLACFYLRLLRKSLSVCRQDNSALLFADVKSVAACTHSVSYSRGIGVGARANACARAYSVGVDTRTYTCS